MKDTKLSVDFGFNLGQIVHYICYRGLYEDATIEQGVIQGFQVRENRIGVDFKRNNNIPIENVSEDKITLETRVNKYNPTPPEDRILD